MTQTETVPGLDGQKMSKSYGNTIDIFGEEKEMRKRVMSIVTDSTPVEAPKDPEASSIFQLYSFFATPEEAAEMRAAFAAGGTGYGDFKKQLFGKLWEFFAPMRQRREEILAHPDYIDRCPGQRRAAGERNREPSDGPGAERRWVHRTWRRGARRASFPFNSAKMSRPAAGLQCARDHHRRHPPDVRAALVDHDHRPIGQITDRLMPVAAFLDQIQLQLVARHHHRSQGMREVGQVQAPAPAAAAPLGRAAWSFVNSRACSTCATRTSRASTGSSLSSSPLSWIVRSISRDC